MVSTYLGITTTTYQVENRSWLLSPAGAGPGENPTVTLDVSAFTAADHYPNGYIPSGTILGTITASTSGGVWMVGPYLNTASDGTQTAAGILFSSVKVPDPANTALDVAGAIVVRGYVDPNKLPFTSSVTTGGFLDTAGRADLPLIHFAPVTP